MKFNGLKNSESLLLRNTIMMRQAGNVSGTLGFLIRTDKDDVRKREALLEHMKCDLSDLLQQVKLMARDLNISYDEIFLLGEDRYEEAKNEFVKKGKSSFWI